MDIVSEQVYLPTYRRKRRRSTSALIFALAWVVVYWFEKKTGLLALLWKSIARGFFAVLAGWIEDASGTSLFTLEGNEPSGDPTSYFSRSRRKNHRAVAAIEAPGKGEGSGRGGARFRDAAAHAKHGSNASAASSGAVPKDLDVPQFLLSTKFFACLELDDSRKVAEATTTVTLAPHSMLFQKGDDSSSGIFVVVEGRLAMFLADGDGEAQTNTLMPGESVGDLDVIDGAKRSITCMALGEGAVLVQLSRAVFVAFLAERPKALQMYLEQGVARLWRVANFMISDYLDLELPGGGPPAAASQNGSVRAAGSCRSSAALRLPGGWDSPAGRASPAPGQQPGWPQGDMPDPDATVPGAARGRAARRRSKPAAKFVGFQPRSAQAPDGREAAPEPRAEQGPQPQPGGLHKSRSLSNLFSTQLAKRGPTAIVSSPEASPDRSISLAGQPSGDSPAGQAETERESVFETAPSQASFWSAVSTTGSCDFSDAGSERRSTSLLQEPPKPDPSPAPARPPLAASGDSAVMHAPNGASAAQDVAAVATGSPNLQATISSSGIAAVGRDTQDAAAASVNEISEPLAEDIDTARGQDAAARLVFSMGDAAGAGTGGGQPPSQFADRETRELLQSKLRGPETTDVGTSPMPVLVGALPGSVPCPSIGMRARCSARCRPCSLSCAAVYMKEKFAEVRQHACAWEWVRNWSSAKPRPLIAEPHLDV